jgi:putative CocE/NonD family hydrolase
MRDDVDAPFGVPLPVESLRSQLDAAEDRAGACRVREVSIPMRDGVELAADVYLPSPQLGRNPAVVFGTPYDKGNPVFTMPEASMYQKAGYVAVVFDVRGRGKSEGEWQGPSMFDAYDGHDVIEWAARQDWCTGNVGISGLSYGGWLVWAAISQHPQHLRAAISTSPVGRWMQECPYIHGCFQLGSASWLANVRRRILDKFHNDISSLLQILPIAEIGRAIDSAGRIWEQLMQHDTLDELWRSMRWDDDYGQFDIPCLHVTGWHDREDLQGAFHHYEHMIDASPASDRQWLIVGPWSHGSSRWPSRDYGGITYGDDAALDMHAIHVRFFDRILRGQDNGLESEPRVRLYDTGAHTWRVPSRWQPTDLQERPLYLAADGKLGEEPMADASDAYVYDPADPSGIAFDVTKAWEPPLDLNAFAAHSGVLGWQSDSLTAPLTMHGWSSATLFAATDCEDTDWHVKLADLTPAGEQLTVAWGCLRATHADGLEARSTLTPNEVRRYDIELSPAFHTFQPGHRISLLVASADWPMFARNLNQSGPIGHQHEIRVATNTIYHGHAHPSCVTFRHDAKARTATKPIGG